VDPTEPFRGGDGTIPSLIDRLTIEGAIESAASVLPSAIDLLQRVSLQTVRENLQLVTYRRTESRHATPLMSVDPYAVAGGIRALTVFPSPPLRRDQRKRETEGNSVRAPDRLQASYARAYGRRPPSAGQIDDSVPGDHGRASSLPLCG
jgi:hypothetical protein